MSGCVKSPLTQFPFFNWVLKDFHYHIQAEVKNKLSTQQLQLNLLPVLVDINRKPKSYLSSSLQSYCKYTALHGYCLLVIYTTQLSTTFIAYNKTIGTIRHLDILYQQTDLAKIICCAPKMRKCSGRLVVLARFVYVDLFFFPACYKQPLDSSGHCELNKSICSTVVVHSHSW